MAVLTIIPVISTEQFQATLTTSSNLTGTSQVFPTPLPGEITLGAHVQVTGTSGDGLRLRAEPSIGSQVRLLGSEAEVFRVDDGPLTVDGFIWWYLVGPFDENRRGWAVSNYLKVVQNP